MKSSSTLCKQQVMWYNQGMTEKETLPLNLGLDIAARKMSCFYSFCFGRAITSHSTFPKQAPALCVTPTCLMQAGTTAAGTGCLCCSVHSGASKTTPWQGQIEPASHAMKPIFCRGCAKYLLEFARGTEQVLLHRKKL